MADEITNDTIQTENGDESVAKETEESGEKTAGQGAEDIKKDQATEEDKKSEEASKEEPRKLKLKINGVEQFFDEAEVIKRAQMAEAAQQRFNEAAQMRKEAAMVLQKLKENPLEVLAHPELGIDVKQFATDYLMKELEKEEMSPEARKAAELEQQLEQERKAREELLKQQEEAKMQAMEEYYMRDYEAKIQQALEEVDIPKTPDTVRRMVGYMAPAIDNGVELPAVEAAKLVKADYMAENLKLLQQLDGDTLFELLGESVAGKIRKADLARLEKAMQKAREETAAENRGEAVDEGDPEMPKNDADTESRKYMNLYEWREYMEKLQKK